MSSHEFVDKDGRDEFEQLISGLRDEVGDTISYNERDGYYAVRLNDDTLMLTKAFLDHVSDYDDLAPGKSIPDAYYEIVDHYLNTVDSGRLKDMQKGDIVSTVGSALFVKFDYFESQPVDYDSVSGEDKLIGQFYRIVTLPLYSQEFDDSGKPTQRRAFKPTLVLVNPSIEDASGQCHNLSQLFVCVPLFMDKEVQFVKRIYQEPNL